MSKTQPSSTTRKRDASTSEILMKTSEFVSMDPNECDFLEGDYRRRNEHRYLRVVPIMRVVGFSILLGMWSGYEVLGGSSLTSSRCLTVIAVVLVYNFLCFGFTQLLRRPHQMVALCDLFFGLDIAIWAYVVAVSGGPESWLFPILMIRSADQSTTTSRRVVTFGVIATLSYLILLAGFFYAEHPIAWENETAKVLILVTCYAYAAVATRAAERLRDKLSTAVRTGKTLAHKLAKKSGELNSALTDAQQAVQAKMDFLANMSHEIRTPMNGILGTLQLLRETPISEEQEDYVKTISQSGEALLILINDILDLSKIEAGKIAIERRPFSLDDLVDHVGGSMSAIAHEKGLSFDTHVEPGLPELVVGDSTRLTQILMNLAGNAVKFTSTGGVCLQVTKSMGTENPRVLFEVRDTGIGIDQGKQKEIFETFSQADTSTTRRYGGTGLGLSISRKLCELLGGKLTVVSQPGLGSSFSFVLPLGPLNQADSVSPPSGWLFVSSGEDKPLALQIEAHCPTIETVGLDQNRNAFERPIAPPKSGVIFSLPKDGDISPLAAKLKASGHRVLIVTRRGDRARAEQARSNGFEVLMRPLSRRRLTAILAGHSPKVAKKAPLGTADLLPSGRALVVEDNPINQKVVCGLLSRLGWSAIPVDNGEDALNVVQQEDFDLILMDCHMPVMDGFTATRNIRMLERCGKPKTPIVALTASVTPLDQTRVRTAGMDDFLPKPLRLDDLRMMLAKHHQLAPSSPCTLSVPRLRPAAPENALSSRSMRRPSGLAHCGVPKRN